MGHAQRQALRAQMRPRGRTGYARSIRRTQTTANFDVTSLRSEVARIIAPTMEIRRGSLSVSGMPPTEPVDAPPTGQDIDEFPLQCPLGKEDLTDLLPGENEGYSVELSYDDLAQFLERCRELVPEQHMVRR